MLDRLRAKVKRLSRAGVLLPLLLLLQAALGGAQSLEARVLASHNRERSGAGVAPLVWDAVLQQSAARWSARLARTGQFAHSGGSKGENLWAGTAGRYTPEEMVSLWTAEKRSYKPGVFPESSRSGRLEDVGHYTQLMWRRTSRVGCALARSTHTDYLVCHYSSPGNVVGERPF